MDAQYIQISRALVWNGVSIMSGNDWKNAEGYNDPTYKKAIDCINMRERKMRRLIKAIITICDCCGYEVVSRIVLKEKS